MLPSEQLSYLSLTSESTRLQDASTRQRVKSILNRVRRVFLRRNRRWLMVIINPASGQGTPDLRTMNRVISEAGYDWEVEVTNQWGDGARLARAAVNNGASLVAAHGGDGTIMDVATGLLESKTPLAILPGGTGNALARELLIPFDVASACALMVQKQPSFRTIDLGLANDHLFLLRFGVGLEAQITRIADRTMKDRLGLFAYVAATVQAWNTAPISNYCLEMDGQKTEIEGLACMVANAGTLGIPGVNISPRVRIDDGLLDVFVIRRADLAELTSLAASVIGASGPNINSLPHWQCREIQVTADPVQGIEADGEELGVTPAHVVTVPGAIRVVVPPAAG